MFDVAFSEVVVIGIVALIVIGPEKLPKVARTLGLLAGRVQRYVSDVKSDLEREMQFEDLQKLQEEIKHSVLAAKSEVDQFGQHINHEVQAISAEVSATAANVVESGAAEAKVSDAKISEAVSDASKMDQSKMDQSKVDQFKLDELKLAASGVGEPAANVTAPVAHDPTPAPVITPPSAAAPVQQSLGLTEAPAPASKDPQ